MTLEKITQKRVGQRGAQKRVSRTDPNREYWNTGRGINYPKAPHPNIIKLTPENLPQTASYGAKYQEHEQFISKKILQGLPKVASYVELKRLEKYAISLKLIDIVKAADGKILYMFKGNDRFLEQKDVEANYIHIYENNVWDYYIQNNKKIQAQKARKGK